MMDPSDIIRARQKARADDAETARTNTYLSTNLHLIEQIRAESIVAFDGLRRQNWPDDTIYQFCWINGGDGTQIPGWRLSEEISRMDYADHFSYIHFGVYLLSDGSLLNTTKPQLGITSPDFGVNMLQRVLEGLRRLVALLH